MFRVELLPAKHGDAILVEYGDRRVRRLLIDGGPLGAYRAIEKRLKAIPQADQRVEVVVITHVDTDHIDGMIRLLAPRRREWPIVPEEIWFNGWRHLEEARDLGGHEGELLSALVHQRANESWNTSFGHNAVRLGSVSGDRVVLADGMTVTLLSPDSDSLEALLADWKKSALNWDITPGDLEKAWEQLAEESKYHPDSELTLGSDDATDQLRKLLKGRDPSAANGSSIAFIAEYGGKSCMLLADAHMDVVCQALRNLGHTKENRRRVDAVKLSHHGSKNNTTTEFLELIDTQNYLFSTNGDQHGHPNAPTIEAIIQFSRRKPTLWFNYRSPSTEVWEVGSKGPGARYATKYPEPGEEGITVPL